MMSTSVAPLSTPQAVWCGGSFDFKLGTVLRPKRGSSVHREGGQTLNYQTFHPHRNIKKSPIEISKKSP